MLILKNIEAMYDTNARLTFERLMYVYCIYVVDMGSMKCDICGQEDARWICEACDNKMVCNDCDQKWHQHRKRQNHVREPLKLEQSSLVNGISPSSSFPGSFTRTSSTSKINEGLSGNTTVGKSPVLHENMTLTAGASFMPTSLSLNEPLVSGEVSTVQQSDVNFLPKSVAEINEDLSYRSLLGVNDSLTPERTLSGQSASLRTPDIVRGSISRQFSSLTSDFQSTLQSLQSMMDEVSSSMDKGQIDVSGDSNLSLSQAVNKQTVVSKSPDMSGISSNYSHSASATVKKLESNQSMVQNADKRQRNVDDDDDELTRLLAQTKYPPNMGSPGLPTPPSVIEQAAANMKPQSTGQSVDPKSSFLHNVTSNSVDRIEPKDSIQRPSTSNDLPRTVVQNTPPVENRSYVHPEQQDVQTSTGTFNNVAQSGRQFATDRQKSQTLVKKRLTDSPGVVCSRVGDGEELGVLERPSGYSETYHSKFSDVHDEVT